MKSQAAHANRLRRRRGISMSGVRRIEKILALGERAARRQFVAVERGVMTGGQNAF